MNKKQKNIIVTGANGNLGKSYVDFLLTKGYKVIGLDITFSDQLQYAKDSNYIPMKVDITNEEEVKKANRLIISELGTIDGLVNNASYNQIILNENNKPIGIEDLTIEEWNKTLAVNLTGAFICSREFGIKMVSEGNGSIVNIASIYGLIAPDQRIYGDSRLNSNAIYGTSKAGLIQLTKYMAAYWQGTGVRVNSISPGGIKSNQDPDFIERYSFKTMIGRMGTPQDICHALDFLISDKSAWTTGANFIIDGGFSSW